MLRRQSISRDFEISEISKLNALLFKRSKRNKEKLNQLLFFINQLFNDRQQFVKDNLNYQYSDNNYILKLKIFNSQKIELLNKIIRYLMFNNKNNINQKKKNNNFKQCSSCLKQKKSIYKKMKLIKNYQFWKCMKINGRRELRKKLQKLKKYNKNLKQ
ncbi:unnamed protein product [Paramecium pentaurelia]|uniref:Uncharacterized protein n=1 Tax=Paramecium pentaurelia TaxID=43138 RepID=A0A8S1SGN8_9CILI|nr:unnamed protein product [Paramecium pentaurelia]